MSIQRSRNSRNPSGKQTSGTGSSIIWLNLPVRHALGHSETLIPATFFLTATLQTAHPQERESRHRSPVCTNHCVYFPFSAHFKNPTRMAATKRSKLKRLHWRLWQSVLLVSEWLQGIREKTNSWMPASERHETKRNVPWPHRRTGCELTLCSAWKVEWGRRHAYVRISLDAARAAPWYRYWPHSWG